MYYNKPTEITEISTFFKTSTKQISRNSRISQSVCIIQIWTDEAYVLKSCKLFNILAVISIILTYMCWKYIVQLNFTYVYVQDVTEILKMQHTTGDIVTLMIIITQTIVQHTIIGNQIYFWMQYCLCHVYIHEREIWMAKV